MHNKKLISLAFASLILATFFHTVVQAANKVEPKATPLSIRISNPNEVISEKLLTSIKAEVVRHYATHLNEYDFYVGSIGNQGDWALVSLSVWYKSENGIFDYDNFVEDETLLLHLLLDNMAESALSKDPGFNDLILRSPDSLIDTSAKAALTGTSVMQVNTFSTTSLKFPWPDTVQRYFSFGWHLGFQQYGVDLGTTGSDRRILAMADGVVTEVFRCSYSARITIQHNGQEYKYVHFDVSSVPSTIAPGTIVTQGQLLGSDRPGWFGSDGNDLPCGRITSSQQNSISSHIHLEMPSNITQVIDGWSITYPNNVFVKGSSSITPSTNPIISSTNIPNPGKKEILQLSGFYDGDNKTDLAMFDPNNGHWYIRPSTGGLDWDISNFGWSTVIPIGGSDYDGDGRTDLAMFEPGNGHWYIRPSGGGLDWDISNFGWDSIIPVGGINYDYIPGNTTQANKRDDLVMFDPRNGHWYIRPSSGGLDIDIANFGWSTIIPVGGGDYDGDGRDDLTMFDPGNGHWYMRPRKGGLDWDIPNFGWSTILPVGGGNYAGTAATDFVIYDKITGRWYIRPSGGGQDITVTNMGWEGAIPKPGMYYDIDTGTNKADLTIFDKNTGRWYIRPSTGGADVTVTNFGWKGVLPL